MYTVGEKIGIVLLTRYYGEARTVRSRCELGRSRVDARCCKPVRAPEGGETGTVPGQVG